MTLTALPSPVNELTRLQLCVCAIRDPRDVSEKAEKESEKLLKQCNCCFDHSQPILKQDSIK